MRGGGPGGVWVGQGGGRDGGQGGGCSGLEKSCHDMEKSG